MIIEKEQITAILDDLESKKENIEGREGYMKDVPPNYVASAIYSHVINELRGLMDGQNQLSRESEKNV